MSYWIAVKLNKNIFSSCRLTLSIDEISLENFHDFVFIYDGNSTDGKLIKRQASSVFEQLENNLES